MSNDQELLMLSTQIIETQNKISQSLSNYPRLNPEQIAVKPIEVLAALLRQIDYLFNQYQDQQSKNLDNDYDQMMNEKVIADCNMLKMQLNKSDEMIKGLKTEKDYYSKQLDCLRKEVETLKTQNQQLQLNISNISMFDQQHQQPLSYSSFGEPSVDKRSSSQSKQSNNQSTYQSNSKQNQGNNNNQQLQFQMQQQEQNISALQKDIKDLKFEIQQKDETIIMKQDQISSLQNQLENIKKNQSQDLEKVRKDITNQQELVQQKEQIIAKLQATCEEMMNAHSIEIPLHKYQVSRKVESHNMQSLDQRKIDKNLSKSDKKLQNRSLSQQKSAFKNKLQFMRDIYEEAQNVLDDGMNFNNDESLRIPSQANLNSVNKNKKKTLQFVNEPMLAIGAEQLIDLDEVLCNQIQAARLAEQTLMDLQKDDKKNLTQFDDIANQYKQVKDQYANLQKQKEELMETTKQVQKENDQVKAKFATLLDQFQEYVNLSEERQFQEESQIRNQQDLMVQELTQNIQELEQHSFNLQQELQQKDELYNLLKSDFNRLEAKYEEQEKQHLNFDGQKERQIQALEEEVKYLQKHFEVEVGLSKDENEILKRELREVNARRLLEQNQMILKGHPNKQGSPQRDINHYHHQEQQQQVDNRNGVSPFKSQSQSNLKANSYQDLNQSMNQNQQRVKEMVNSTQANFEKFKRDIIEKEKIIEEKNQEILRLRISFEEAISSQKYQNSKQSTAEQELMRKNIVYDIGIALGKLRQELSKSKAMLTKEQNQFERFDSNVVAHKQIQEDGFLADLQEYIQEMRQLVSMANEVQLLFQYDIEKNARNNSLNTSSLNNHIQSSVKKDNNMSYGNLSQAPQMNLLDQNYQIKRSADSQLRNGQINQLYDSLMSQVCKVESLMQDNAILQRTLHKYETTLSELDTVLREAENGNVILDLKRIAEQQLKEIVSLQREVEIVKFNGQSPQPQAQSVQQFINQQRALQIQDPNEINQLRHQVEDLNYQLMKLKAIQSENSELIQERKTLLQLCEDLERQVKDGHKSLEEALEKIMQLERDFACKENEQEEIRQRITEVAELFEKKEIKQKYSFEVLCDFIHDKAKRLFSKYDNVVKEAKSDKNQFAQQRNADLEQENDNLRSVIMQSNFIAKEAIKRLSRMINEQLPQVFENQSESYDQELGHILDRVDHVFKEINEENFQLKDRLQDIIHQLDIYQNEVVGSKDQERLQLRHSEELLRRDVEQLKKDKERMVDRNSDLALALKDMTEDYKLQREENERLKERLFLYERNSSQMHQSIMFTPVRNNTNNQMQYSQPLSQHQQVPPLKLLSDVTNRSAGKLDISVGLKNLNSNHRDLQNDYAPDMMADIRRENHIIDKFQLLGQRMNSNQSTSQHPMIIKEFSDFSQKSTKVNNKDNEKGGFDNYECTSSHFTDEDDDMPTSHQHQLHSNQLYSENKRSNLHLQQNFY
eukprot:403351526